MHATPAARHALRWPRPLLAAAAVAIAATACGDGGDDRTATATPAATATAAPAAFDGALAGQLQQVLDAAVADPDAGFPGAILRVSGPDLGVWSGAAGLAQIEPRTPMRTDDRFRAGSIVKTFVSVVVLQLAEEGALSLDDPLTAVAPESVHARFPEGDRITVRMLLNHTSGLPEWLGPAVVESIAGDPARVWDVAEFLEFAAAQPPNFAPGTSYTYSNTDYTLLGEIIESTTANPWRDEVTARVIQPLGLEHTLLPEPGDASIPGNHAHGYAGATDLTAVDPSMAGAAGGGALVTDVADLARFWDAVLAGALFDDEATLREMLAFVDAPDVGGQVGYGLGVQRYIFPDGTEVIGHLGGTAGYFAFVGYLPAAGVTFAALVNAQNDPSPLLVPAVRILAAGGAQ